MSAICDKRLHNEYSKNMKEKKLIEENIFEIDPSGIYLYINPENIRNQQALIIGPKDTPYENGFYVFDIIIPNEYPYKPPSAKFLTTDGHIRFNPNLYSNGKVCLSILGTWSGPAWTSLMNINTVLQYLRMIMNNDPLRNEPAYYDPETRKDLAEKYWNYVYYNNHKFAINEVFNKEYFPKFKNIIKNLYIYFYNNNIKKINEKQNITIDTVVYYNNIICDYTSLNNIYKNNAKYQNEKTDLELNFEALKI